MIGIAAKKLSYFLAQLSENDEPLVVELGFQESVASFSYPGTMPLFSLPGPNLHG